MIRYDLANQLKMNTIYNTKINKKVGMENILEKIINRAKNEMSNEYYYRPIEEHIGSNGTDPVAEDVTFKIVQDERNFNKHFLELFMQPKNSRIEVSRPLAYGDKEEIIEFLNHQNIIKIISKEIKDMIEEI